MLLTSMVFLIVLAGVIGMVEERSETASLTQEAAAARIIAEKVSQSLEEVYSGGEGHGLIVKMPPEINGNNYVVRINSSGVFVDMSNQNCFSTSSVPRVTGPKNTEEQVLLYPAGTYNITHHRDENGNHYLVIGEIV
ncbi:MAG: hypothetical protein ABFC91_03700 [Methanobacteriaceae archaeon]